MFSAIQDFEPIVEKLVEVCVFWGELIYLKLVRLVRALI